MRGLCIAPRLHRILLPPPAVIGALLPIIWQVLRCSESCASSPLSLSLELEAACTPVSASLAPPSSVLASCCDSDVTTSAGNAHS